MQTMTLRIGFAKTSCCSTQGTISSLWGSLRRKKKRSVCVYAYMMCAYMYVYVYTYVTGSLCGTAEISPFVVGELGRLGFHK